MSKVEYVDAYTWHGREGNLENAFKYKVGFVDQPYLTHLVEVQY